MQLIRKFTLFHITLAVISLLSTANLLIFTLPMLSAGTLFGSRRTLMLVTSAVVVAAAQFVLLGMSLFMKPRVFQRLYSTASHVLGRQGKFFFVMFFALACVYPFLLLGFLGESFSGLPERATLFILLWLYGSVALSFVYPKQPWWEYLAAAGLVYGAVHRAALYRLDISDNPFSLSWSEASRYYYASLFFSKQIYGTEVAPTVLHPSRYLMQSLPFLLPDSSILIHRVWQVFLWVGVTSATAAGFVRRLRLSERLRGLTAFGWAFLFLLLGPVYYHLQIPALVVLWLYDHRKPWRIWAVVGFASIWAGISRVNWFPVPGMLAAVLYLLEERIDNRSLFRYLLRPTAWTVLGILVAFAAQGAYTVWSGNPPGQFATSFSSDLLWYRLLPNPTYPLGILPSISLVCLPFALVFIGKLNGKLSTYHPIRLVAVSAVLLALLGGGLLVSVKIGGGSNLHNLDAFLAVLMVVAGYLVADKFTQDHPDSHTGVVPWQRWMLLVGIVSVLAFPGIDPMSQGAEVKPYDREKIQQELYQLRRLLSAPAGKGKSVLFISERQLLTFKEIQDLTLIPDYEKVFLMEMVMGEDPEYLARFWTDIEQQRFSVIVSDTLFLRLKGRLSAFGEENDAWVIDVNQKILCSYKSRKRFDTVNLQLLIPRLEGGDCPALQQDSLPEPSLDIPAYGEPGE